jgi:hypothetical protein
VGPLLERLRRWARSPRPPWAVVLVTVLLTAAGAPARAGWTEQEEWVRARVEAGQRADLDEMSRDHPGRPRVLTGAFLLDLIAGPTPERPEARARPPAPHGIWITGALFEKGVDLSEVRFERPLRLENSTFAGGLSLARAKLDGLVSLEGSRFAGVVDLGALQVGRDLVLGGRGLTTFEDEVLLLGAKVGGSVVADGSGFRRKLDLGGAQVEGSVSLGPGALFESDVLLVQARISGGLHAQGATFRRVFNVDGAKVGQNVRLAARFTFADGKDAPDGVNATLRDARIEGALDLRGSAFEGRLDMRNVETRTDLLMSAAAFRGHVLLLGAKIGGNLLLEEGLTFDCGCELDMSGVEVGESLILRPGPVFTAKVRLIEAEVGDSVKIGGPGSTFARPVILVAATVGDTLDVYASRFEDTLDLGGIKIGNSLFLHEGSTFTRDVLLIEAVVGDSLTANGSIFERVFDARRAVIGQSLEMRRSRFLFAEGAAGDPRRVNVAVRDAKVGGTLDAGGSEFRGLVDLTGTDVGQLFAWPAAPAFELHGLTYKRLPQRAPGDAEWPWLDWLGRDESYSPQPYQQLAAISREMGEDGRANDALFASRERERSGLPWSWGWLGLSLLRWTIGYGLGAGYLNALYLMLAFTVVGAVVLRTSPASPRTAVDVTPGTPTGSWSWCLGASLDEMLPLIDLDQEHARVINARLEGLRKNYFYLHRILAYVLGSFVVAGLAGLTQGR